jgi:nucleotide-binding universal stress UspA family protein
MPPTIVVPLDGSPFSARALPAALSIARAGKATLRLVGVVHHGMEIAIAPLRRHLEEVAELTAADGPLDIEVIVNDDPAAMLLEIADGPGTVLCFASHDHLPVATAIMHSVGSILIERATHPFIVVGAVPDGDAPPAPAANDVVVAVDGVDEPEPLLSTAMAWARDLQAALRIVTVYEPVPGDVRNPAHFTRHHGPPGDPEAYVQELGRRLEENGVVPIDVAAVPDATSVADGLTRHLQDRPALLAVVGGRRPGDRALGPGVLRRLLRESPVPLLVAPRT